MSSISDLNLNSIIDDSIDIDNRSIYSNSISKHTDDLLLRPAVSAKKNTYDSSYDTLQKSHLPKKTTPFSDSSGHNLESTTNQDRTVSDLEPNMDALLITAQSVLIKDGIKLFMSKNYSSQSLEIYREAFYGIELYIKLLTRNAENAKKISNLAKRDADCKYVVSFSFNLYKKLYKKYPEKIDQQIKAFKIIHSLFEDAINKASINFGNSQLRFFYHLSEELDDKKVKQYYESNDPGFLDLIKKLTAQIRVALKMAKNIKLKKETDISLRDINTYIIRASGLLKYYYTLTNEFHSSRYHARIHDIYTEFQIVVK